MGWLVWVGAILAIALIVAGVVWAIANFRPAGEAAAPAPTASSTGEANDPGPTPTPQPTVFATPKPGATTPQDKPQEPVEVSLDETAESVDDVSIDVTKLEAVTAGGSLPGEPSGPAIAVSVRITNNGKDAVDTSGSNVNLTYGGDARLPAVGLSGDTTSVWPASVKPGDDATAVFLFSVPDVPKGDIRVIVDLLASAPDVVFSGPRP
jgi:hypothetical protein